MTLCIVFTPEAEDELAQLHSYLAASSSPDIASRYVHRVVTYCEGLAQSPYRGVARDDIRPGLRTVRYKRDVVIAFAVLTDTVAIVGVFYGGRAYETILDQTDTS